MAKKVLLHVHTSYSLDSIMDKYLLLMMCKIRGIDCLAITDHNEIEGALSWRGFLQSHGVSVIVGEEIFTNQGEIIGLFLEKKISRGMTVQETIDAIEQQNAIVYIPHPYDLSRQKSVLEYSALLQYKERVQLIEIHNGRNRSKQYTLEQQRIGKEVGAIPVVGEDAHCFFEVGRNYLILPDFYDKETFLKAISSPLVIHVSESISFAHFVTKCVRIYKMIKMGRYHELYRAIEKKIRKYKHNISSSDQ